MQLTSRLNARGRAVPAEGRRPPVPPRRAATPRSCTWRARSSAALRASAPRRGRRAGRAPAAADPGLHARACARAWGSPRTPATARASASARCALLADGIVRAHERGIMKASARARRGGGPLRRGRGADRRAVSRAFPGRADMSSDDAFLDAAESIGRRIVADAVWHDGRCSWVGAVMDSAQPWRAEYRALGAEPVRRHRGRRSVPRTARRRDRRRRLSAAPPSERCVTPSRGRRRCRPLAATAFMRARSAWRGLPLAPPRSWARRSCMPALARC